MPTEYDDNATVAAPLTREAVRRTLAEFPAQCDRLYWLERETQEQLFQEWWRRVRTEHPEAAQQLYDEHHAPPLPREPED